MYRDRSAYSRVTAYDGINSIVSGGPGQPTALVCGILCHGSEERGDSQPLQSISGTDRTGRGSDHQKMDMLDSQVSFIRNLLMSQYKYLCTCVIKLDAVTLHTGTR